MEGFDWFSRLRNSFQHKKEQEINSDWPDWYKEYFLQSDFKHRTSALVKELPIVVIDAETTGLNLKRDRLISLGGLRVQGNLIKVAEQFEAYLPTPAELQNSGAVAIHGIVPNSRYYKYSQEEEMLVALLDFLKDGVIVGHHIRFDVTMINQSLARYGAGKLRNQVIDTAAVAERLQPAGYWSPNDQYSLDQLARRYRIPLSDRHTALGDAYITAVLWLKLISRLGERVQREIELADLKHRGR